MMQFLTNTRIDFLGKKILALGLSVIAIVISLGYIVTNGLNLGIDFEGGNLVHLKFRELPEIEYVRALLEAAGYSPVLQADVDRNELMIRVGREENNKTSDSGEVETSVTSASAEEKVAGKIVALLLAAEGADENLLNLNLAGREQLVGLLIEHDPMEYLKTESDVMTPEAFAHKEYSVIAARLIDEYRERTVGGLLTDMDAAIAASQPPHHEEEFRLVLKEHTYLGSFSTIRAEMVSAAVGAELGEQTMLAVIYSLSGILAYVWFRFNPRFSVAAIIALVHDVIISVGIYSMSGREFNLPIVAAVLTIVGYSLNDTIVIFVRIRENLNIRRREAQQNYEGILNNSINKTLSRTLLTSGTTLIMVLSLYFLGGSVINDFAFIMIIGVLVGTYSSVFIASPILAIWQKFSGTTGGAMVRTKFS